MPVHTFVALCALNGGVYYATWDILFFFFNGCTFGGVYIPCIYSHARWNYRGRFRSLLLCPLLVEGYSFHLFVNSLQRCTIILSYLICASIVSHQGGEVSFNVNQQNNLYHH